MATATWVGYTCEECDALFKLRGDGIDDDAEISCPACGAAVDLDEEQEDEEDEDEDDNVVEEDGDGDEESGEPRSRGRR